MRISKFVRRKLWFTDTKKDFSIQVLYINCANKLQDTCLRLRESFYSFLDLRDTVSESDYAHVTNVWQQFSVQSLDEYSDLYLKTDVLLLADIFENFRDKCIESYGLDPYYYTLSGFTWDAMLKHTRINFELFTNIWWFYRARYTRRS